MTVLCSWLTCHTRQKCLHYNIWRDGNHPISYWIVLMQSPLISNDSTTYSLIYRRVRLAEVLLPSLLGS